LNEGAHIPGYPSAPPALSAGSPFPGLLELPQREFDLHAVLRPVFRHLSLILAITIGLVVISAIKVSLTPRVYTAVATVLIKPHVPDITVLRGEGVNADDADELYDNFYKTQYSVLRSRSLAAQVIQSQNLAAVFTAAASRATPGIRARLRAFMARAIGPLLGGHAGGEDAAAAAQTIPAATATVSGQDHVPSGLIDAYLSGLTITPVEDTSLVEVGYTFTNPVIAATIANAHAEAYIREGIELQNQSNIEAQRFLQQRLVELKEKLQASEMALNDYRRQNGIVPGLMTVDGRNTIVLGRLADLSHDLTGAQVRRLNLEASVDLIRKHSYDSLPEVMQSGPIQQLEAKLAQLQTEYAAMAQQFKGQYPPLLEMQARLNETRRTLAAEIGTVVSGIQAAYQQAVDNQNKLQAELDQQRALALKLNDAAVQYAILQREVETNRQLYDAVLQRIKDLGVEEGSQASNVSIVDHAEVPKSPSAPNARQTLILSAVLGLSGGVALAFLLDYLDNTLKDGEDVERYLKLPNLVAVPNFAQPNLRIGYGSRRYLERQTAPAVDHQVSGELVLSTGNFSRASEAYRVLRTRILLSRAGEPPKTLLFTSATPAEGKTVTAINAAIMFSQLGVRVLLVDADLRHPRAHEVLKINNEAGLTEVLTGQRGVLEAVRPVMLTTRRAYEHHSAHHHHGQRFEPDSDDASAPGLEPEPEDAADSAAPIKAQVVADPEAGAAAGTNGAAHAPGSASRPLGPTIIDSNDWRAGLRSFVAGVAGPTARQEASEPPRQQEPSQQPGGEDNHAGPTRHAEPLNGLTDYLYILPSGTIPPNPSELLGSPKMLETLEVLEKSFDYVIIDSPPIMPVSDSIVLSTMVDGVILVIDQERTPKQVVKAACSRLEFTRAHVFGAVLNKVDLQQGNPYSYYDHYYHSDYGSGYKSSE